MFIIRGLRFPTALAFGMFLTGSIFWSLWFLTNVTFEIQAVKSVPIEFSRLLLDTPPQRKSVEEIKVPPVIELPPPIDAVTGEKPVIATTIEPPPITAGKPDQSIPNFGNDRDVLPLVRINPIYPPRAIARNIEGWVKVQFTVSGTGAVTDVVVVESSPPNVFDNAALDAVSRWRYNPKVEGAVAVERVGMQTILRFDLEEE